METLTDNKKEIKELVEKTNLKHIAIIMDGNRRWAKEKGLPSAVGHKKGVDALKRTVYACDDYGIKYLTVYAFSPRLLRRYRPRRRAGHRTCAHVHRQYARQLNRDRGQVLHLLSPPLEPQAVLAPGLRRADPL